MERSFSGATSLCQAGECAVGPAREQDQRIVPFPPAVADAPVALHKLKAKWRGLEMVSQGLACLASADELQQVILDFIARYNQTAKPLQWSYTVKQLERKLDTNL